MTTNVKKSTSAKATTRISSKHQVTIPHKAFRDAGLRPGERLEVRADGPGKVVLIREESATRHHAGSLTGVYPAGALNELRGEWD